MDYRQPEAIGKMYKTADKVNKGDVLVLSSDGTLTARVQDTCRVTENGNHKIALKFADHTQIVPCDYPCYLAFTGHGWRGGYSGNREGMRKQKT